MHRLSTACSARARAAAIVGTTVIAAVALLGCTVEPPTRAASTRVSGGIALLAEPTFADADPQPAPATTTRLAPLTHPRPQPAPVAHKTFSDTSGEMPDPSVMRIGDTYYAYATGGDGMNIRLRTSTDLEHWTSASDALPRTGSWAANVDWLTWAPTVAKIGDHYVMYYVGKDPIADVQCIGVATAEGPRGPFVDDSPRPLVCGDHLGGAIDPSIASAADGSLRLLWKGDGNSRGAPTAIYSSRLRADGRKVTGAPVLLLSSDRGWDSGIVENPVAFGDGKGGYWIAFSGGRWQDDTYATGIAHTPNLDTPASKSNHPWIETRITRLVGPGGLEVVAGTKESKVALHTWTSSDVQAARRVRALAFADLDVSTGLPVLHAPWLATD